MTYGGDPANDTGDELRLLIGDTNNNSLQFSDAEIDYFLAQNDNVYTAAAAAAWSLTAKYSRDIGSAIESVRIFAQDRFDQYTRLATSLERQAKKLGTDPLGVPVVSGISEATMRGVVSDSDRVDSKFKQGMFDNPPNSSDDDPIDNDQI